MAFKYEIKVYSDNKFYQNSITFATHQEADSAGRAKRNAWTQADAYRVVETDEMPNYRWDNEAGLVEIPLLPLPEHIRERMKYVEIRS